MRVASKTTYDMVRFNLGNISAKLNDANKTVATGKRINTLSDDPVGLVQSLKIKSDLASLDQLNRNVNVGSTWLDASESALGQVQDMISDAKVLSIQMVTATMGATERLSAATTIQNLLEEIVSQGNTQINGRYIFSGSKTDTPPFAPDGTYNGDTTPFSIKIGQRETFTIGGVGSTIFDTVFTDLAAFKTALETNDIAGITTAMDDMERNFSHISEGISSVGYRGNRMEIKKNIFQDLKITNTERLSGLEDADITAAITNLKEIELAYQAALASSSKVMGLSLVDYIR